ncbi:unnamed protein product [Microthlaspi erraticum]|uniref:Uncharacterized protein n=1 Tax=Microthlaspi erraticum TaxID=1685480 RepID=A0A6D2JAI7_9BRAS|nr:unnamed protein product [Microthlaspi erraticum]
MLSGNLNSGKRQDRDQDPAAITVGFPAESIPTETVLTVLPIMVGIGQYRDSVRCSPTVIVLSITQDDVYGK